MTVRLVIEFDESGYRRLLGAPGPGKVGVHGGRSIQPYRFDESRPKGWADPDELREAVISRYAGSDPLVRDAAYQTWGYPELSPSGRPVHSYTIDAEDAALVAGFHPVPYRAGWEIRTVDHHDGTYCVMVFYDSADTLQHAAGCGFTRRQCVSARAEKIPTGSGEYHGQQSLLI